MRHYPLEAVPLDFSGNDYMVVSMVENYYKLGQADKALALASQLADELLVSARFYLQFYDWAPDEFELVGQYIYFLADVMREGGDADMSRQLTDKLASLVDEAAAAMDTD